jgi:hypothetical protein
MIGDARRALAESAMWSVVGAGSVRRDREELATSFVRYQGVSDGSAEVRTAQGGSSLAAGTIWAQIISWCREHDVTQPRWSVVRGSEPRGFADLMRALGGVFAASTEVLIADIDAALALPAAATALRTEVIETSDQAAFRVLARDPSGVVVSVGECTLADGVARLSGAHTLEAHRRRGAYTAVLRQRLATARDAGATVALARGLAATSAPILARSGFTRYATWDKFTIRLTRTEGQNLD